VLEFENVELNALVLFAVNGWLKIGTFFVLFKLSRGTNLIISGADLLNDKFSSDSVD